MRLLLVTDTFPPDRISGALQMRDLAVALVQLGHRPLVATPSIRVDRGARLEVSDGVEVLRVRAPRSKDVAYWRRTAAEFMLPWFLWRGLRAVGLAHEPWDGIIWYSPTIFLGPLVRRVKSARGCPGYLVLRDIFPDWAVDAGLLRRTQLAYRVFKRFERYQYRQADVIGVQTPANVPLVARDVPSSVRIEVLPNWLAPPPTLDGGETPVCDLKGIEGRVIFVHAGNMGVAQDVGAFLDLAERMLARDDVGFVFVGRGSELPRVRDRARALNNVAVLDEMDPPRLSLLLAACSVGIVALHPAHTTNNIPGKLITYLYAGLPVLARVNPKNDLVGVLESEGVGLAVVGDDPEALYAHACRLADDADARKRMGDRGREVARTKFAPAVIATRILAGLGGARGGAT